MYVKTCIFVDSTFVCVYVCVCLCYILWGHLKCAPQVTHPSTLKLLDATLRIQLQGISENTLNLCLEPVFLCVVSVYWGSWHFFFSGYVFVARFFKKRPALTGVPFGNRASHLREKKQIHANPALVWTSADISLLAVALNTIALGNTACQEDIFAGLR